MCNRTDGERVTDYNALMDVRPDSSLPGRGAAANPGNRFEAAHAAPNPDGYSEFENEDPQGAHRSHPLTQFLPDHTRGILAHNDSPDVGFSTSVNPYRGCEHGCIYCYARPTHEYLGFSAGLDFETRILVKHDAAKLLRAALMHPKYEPETIAFSGVTDCYQPIERKLQLTRQCLAVLAEFANPAGIVTKNHLVTRDIDILQSLARQNAASVIISITTLDARLTRIMEPRTSVPRDRLAAIRELADAGIPVGVIVAPIIPALTDHELPAILKAAADAGASYAAHTPLRLPLGVADLFTDWLGRHFPDRQAKVLNRIRAIRGGQLNDPKFGSRMKGSGEFAKSIHDLFQVACQRAGIPLRGPALSTAHFHRPMVAGQQLPLFGP